MNNEYLVVYDCLFHFLSGEVVEFFAEEDEDLATDEDLTRRSIGLDQLHLRTLLTSSDITDVNIACTTCVNRNRLDADTLALTVVGSESKCGDAGDIEIVGPCILYSVIVEPDVAVIVASWPSAS